VTRSRIPKGWHGRREHNDPSFSPHLLDQYVIREVRVTHWVHTNRFMVSIGLTATFRTERMSSFSLTKRFSLGFENASHPFFLRKAVIDLSMVTFLVSGAPSYLERFKRNDPLLLQSVRSPDKKLKIPVYAFGEFEVPKPPPPDPDDIPF
jgi:hypothetical protein